MLLCQIKHPVIIWSKFPRIVFVDKYDYSFTIAEIRTALRISRTNTAPGSDLTKYFLFCFHALRRIYVIKVLEKCNNPKTGESRKMAENAILIAETPTDTYPGFNNGSFSSVYSINGERRRE